MWAFIGAAVALALWMFVDVALAGGRLTDWGAAFFLAMAAGTALRIATDADRMRYTLHALETAVLAWDAYQAQRHMTNQRSRWSTALVSDGIMALMSVVVRQLMGEDHDSWLVIEEHDGLRNAHDVRYVVPTAAERQLRQKMGQMDGGTVAVCGPRGAGKSTLLRACSTSQQGSRALDLSVFVQAPAEYAPQDFLLTLFGEVCEGYLQGFTQDHETRFFVGVRKRRIFRVLWRAVKWLLSLAVAAAVLAAALGRGAEWIYHRYITPTLFDRLQYRWEQSRDLAVGVWRDHPWSWYTRCQEGSRGISSATPVDLDFAR